MFFAQHLQKPLALRSLREKFTQKSDRFSSHLPKRFLNLLCTRPQVLIDFIRRNHAVVNGSEPTGHDNTDRTGMV